MFRQVKKIVRLLIGTVFLLMFRLGAECTPFTSCIVIPTSCDTHRICDDGRSYFGKTFFSIRPQDSNAANRLLKITQENHQPDDDFRWGIDVSTSFQRSFSKKSLAQWFLFNNTNCMTVGLSTDEQTFDVDGEQFGLVTPESVAGKIGSLCLAPRTENIITNVQSWFSLDHICCGMWLRTGLVLARNKRTLGITTEDSNVAQTGFYPDGFYDVDCESLPIVYTNVLDAFIGNKAIGDVPSLKFVKFYDESLDKVALASLRADLGYDFVRTCNGFLNGSVSIVAPAGTRPNSRHIFEPVVGANRSWQLGLNASGSYLLRRLCNVKREVSIYFDATITHLFKARQVRVCALKNNGPGSQYLLLKRMDLSVGAVLSGERVANILAGDMRVGVPIMFDGAVLLHIERPGLFFGDIGYNLWARAQEKRSSRICFGNFESNTYGIKGDLPLSKIDNFSQLCIGDLLTANQSTVAKQSSADFESITLGACDIDCSVALHPSAISHKLFGALGTAKACSLLTMVYAAVAAEVEFGHQPAALRQWAISVHLGISFE